MSEPAATRPVLSIRALRVRFRTGDGVVEAVREQAGRFTHTDFTVIPYENYVGLAERLIELTPISGEVRAGFFNSDV